MQKQLELVKQFHKKFNASVLNNPSLIPPDRSQLRYNLIKDEVEEYIEGVKNNDLPNIAKELCDILFATYGTILEHGLQGKIEKIFEEVHKSNMSKDYHAYKMVKGENYTKANIDQFFT